MANISNKYHYFYKITNNINGHFYYGVHNTNNLDDGYMGSGTRLHYAYKKYGVENFTKEILKFFDTSKEAFEYEAEIVNENLSRKEECYNILPGGLNFDNSGLVTVKDNEGNALKVSVNDPRYLSGELVGINTGFVAVKDNNGNTLRVPSDDSRYLSGELVGIAKGKALYKDKNGKCFLLCKDDIMIVDKELIPFWKGRFHKSSTINKMKESYRKTNHQKGEKNSQYGTCWITKEKENKKIKKEDLEKYLADGWVKGRYIKYNRK